LYIESPKRITSPTGLWAEGVDFVLVVVLGGGAPAVAVVPAFSGAGVELLSLEGEGELTRSAFCVPPDGEQHCGRRTGIREYKEVIWGTF